MWAVLSALYHAKTHKNNVYSYSKYRGVLNLEGLSFPLQVKDIPKFEKLNTNIAVNVLYWDADDSDRQQLSEFTIEYVSPERERDKQINLLLLQDDVSSKRHYVWISNMSRLVAGRTKYDGKTYVCNSCLHPFSNQRVLDNHIPFCIKHLPQQLVYPNANDPKDCTLTFTDIQKQHKIPFYLVFDFESFLAPLDIDDEDRNTRCIDEHQVSGFCCYRVTDYTQYQTPPRVYSGDNVMETFYNHIILESNKINEIIREQRPMTPLSPEQLEVYKKATVCGNCGEGFTHKNHKEVMHHNHVDGSFMFAACNSCNLQLKPKKCKATKRHHITEDEGARKHYEDNYFLPIVFHILTSYDSHFVIKNVGR